MHTMTIKLTDLGYKSITREATKRQVSPEEAIDDWLTEGEEASTPVIDGSGNVVPFEDEEVATEHDFTERRTLRKWHESLAKRIRSRRPA